MRIEHITSRPIQDTRGRQTIETTLSAGTFSATASVPSGKSTGSHEACELRDADGSVAHAIENVNGEIADALTERSFDSLDELDDFLIALDDSLNKSRLGANALLSVSITAERLSALAQGIPLWKSIAERAGTTPATPRPFVNVLNGGAHVHPATALAKGDRFPLPFQEYMLVIEGKTSTALSVAAEAFAKLGERLPKDVVMGDEGGYAPAFDTLEKPFEILAGLVKEFPSTSIAIDAAASELFHNGAYQLLGKSYSSQELTSLYESIAAKYPIHSIEDPFAEDAGADFARLTEKLGRKILVVGDDLTVTNPARINDAIAHEEINAVLIKPNQIGTVREAIKAVQATQNAGWKVICSHRSGETDDTFISDFAYGVGAHGIKAGGLGQRERLLKYDRLLAIEHEAESM